MHGERNGNGGTVRGTSDPRASTLVDDAIAGDLAREFGAPVGLFDPERRCWRALVGAPEELFPAVDDSLLGVCHSSETRQGRASIWDRPSDPESTWLVLPMLRPLLAELVALVGFSRSADPAAVRPQGNGGTR